MRTWTGALLGLGLGACSMDAGGFVQSPEPAFLQFLVETGPGPRIGPISRYDSAELVRRPLEVPEAQLVLVSISEDVLRAVEPWANTLAPERYVLEVQSEACDDGRRLRSGDTAYPLFRFEASYAAADVELGGFESIEAPGALANLRLQVAMDLSCGLGDPILQTVDLEPPSNEPFVALEWVDETHIVALSANKILYIELTDDDRGLVKQEFGRAASGTDVDLYSLVSVERSTSPPIVLALSRANVSRFAVEGDQLRLLDTPNRSPLAIPWNYMATQEDGLVLVVGDDGWIATATRADAPFNQRVLEATRTSNIHRVALTSDPREPQFFALYGGTVLSGDVLGDDYMSWQPSTLAALAMEAVESPKGVEIWLSTSRSDLILRNDQTLPMGEPYSLFIPEAAGARCIVETERDACDRPTLGTDIAHMKMLQAASFSERTLSLALVDCDALLLHRPESNCTTVALQSTIRSQQIKTTAAYGGRVAAVGSDGGLFLLRGLEL